MGRRTVYGISGLAAAVLSISALAASAQAQPSFEVATVKPSEPENQRGNLNLSRDKFQADGMTLKAIMKFAYDLNFGSDEQISGGPAWVGTERFDIQAKEDAAFVEELDKFPLDERGDKVRLLVQQLLVERFKLKVHHATAELPVYAVTLAKGGSRLTPSPINRAAESGPNATAAENWRGIHNDGRGSLEAKKASLDLFANILGFQPEIGGRIVLNRTRLEGTYDFKLKWTPEAGMGGDSGAPEAIGPSLFTAMQEQLGLRLDATKGPVDTVVIDSVAMPSDN